MVIEGKFCELVLHNIEREIVNFVCCMPTNVRQFQIMIDALVYRPSSTHTLHTMPQC